MEALAPLSPVEALSLGAADSVFFSHYYFPKTVRQETPDFHRRQLWPKLDGPSRKVSFMVFRGSAKTTLLRIYTAKRVAYLISRTILYVGKSQDHAKRSLAWLMRQVEFNALYRDTFLLRPGSKWTAEECTILVGPEQTPVTIIALGITGSTLGVNVDDYRPDLIIVDDPSDEENTLTEDQRNKTEDFILGSLYNSLAPTSEAPLAKIAFLQTLLHPEDAISKCDSDPSWDSSRVSIFNEAGESVWPARWTTEELQKEKQSFIERGKLSLWMREMECTAIGSALASFPRAHEQINYYEITPSVGSMVCAMAVDPVPPPSERQIAEGLRRKDFEAWVVVGLWRDRQTGERRIYVLDAIQHKGHTPDWSVATFLQLRKVWRPVLLKAETVNYQRTLKWLLEQAMMQQSAWTRIDAHQPERRKKAYRIIDTLGSALAQGMLYFHRSQRDLLEQIVSYPSVQFDDLIEALSVAIDAVLEIGDGYLGEDEDFLEVEKDIPELPDMRMCP